jgi:hypothetical protein
MCNVSGPIVSAPLCGLGMYASNTITK